MVQTWTVLCDLGFNWWWKLSRLIVWNCFVLFVNLGLGAEFGEAEVDWHFQIVLVLNSLNVYCYLDCNLMFFREIIYIYLYPLLKDLYNGIRTTDNVKWLLIAYAPIFCVLFQHKKQILIWLVSYLIIRVFINLQFT